MKTAKCYNAKDESRNPNDRFQVGDSYEWTWYNWENMVEKGKVTGIEENKSLTFTFAGEAIVHLELLEGSDKVDVVLTQSNIPLDEKSRREIYVGLWIGLVLLVGQLKGLFGIRHLVE